MNLTDIIIGIIAFLLGIVLGKIIFSKNTKKRIEEAESEAKQIIAAAELKAETTKKEKILEAKEKFVQLKAEFDKEILERNKKLGDSENRIKQKEISINQKDAALEKYIKENEVIKENLSRQLEVVAQKRNQLEKHQEEHIKRLEKIAGLTAEEAKAQLIESLKQEVQNQALQLQQEVIEEAKQKANKEARKIII
ncbi:MAG TPA: Rnase Y domain-containing protein, partial [Parafilimonas sp.]|nr:Rnase Y domain-containing protein [Parafilimonas sp.]